MKKKIFIVAAVIFSGQAQAQKNANSILTDTAKTLDAVVVTANKYSRKQSQTGKVTTIIGKEVLEKSFGRSVADILNQQASLAIPGSQNSFGSNQELYLRGSGKVLLLIDGVPAYDASYIAAGTDLNHIPVESIERIEIVRGALSTLYGSDAIAGVINIITKKGSQKKAEIYAGLSAGSYSTFKQNAGIAGKTKQIAYAVNYNRTTSNGFSAAYDSAGNKNFDNDRFLQNVITGNITAGITEKLQVRLNGQYSRYNFGLDAGPFADDKDFTGTLTNVQAGINAQYKTRHGAVYLNTNINTSERRYVNDSFDISGFASYSNEKYTGHSAFAELYTSQSLGRYVELLGGIDYRYQKSNQDYLSISSYGPYKTNIGDDSVNNHLYSFFASLLLKDINGFNMEIGSRYNRHSQYGSNVTFTFNPSYNIGRGWKIFTNIASAFKAPSLYQLFGPGVANRALKAEKSVTYEGGLQYEQKKFTARAVYFYRNINDGIDYNFATYSYFNNNKQKDRGIELEAMVTLGLFTVNANYTFLTGNVNTAKYKFDPNFFTYEIIGDTVFNNLFRRPKHAFNSTITCQPHKKLTLGVTLHAVGSRFEGQFEAAPVEMKGYYTLDFYAGYAAHRSLQLFADMRNITNQQFADVLGYTARRFNMTAGLRVSF